MKNIEGQNVPQTTFKIRKNGAWAEYTYDELFKGQRVVLFSLPGAFTPTCSSTHLPRYNDLFPLFQENKVDRIVCMSVNDAFVMEAWQEAQNAPNITFVPDGNGEFSEKIGSLVDKSAIGFGKRSWRYSMLVDDGKIEKMFIEPAKDGDPFEVSDAETMLKYINDKVEFPKEATIFTKIGCPHCKRAKEILSNQNIKYHEFDKANGQALRALGGKGTYPLIFLEGKLVGGREDLEKLF